MFKDIITLARPHQYTKNLFIFAPLFFAGMLFDVASLTNTFITFCLFSLAASAIYILNDIKDVAEDKLHPVKKYRPIANNNVSRSAALIWSVSLALFSIICSAFFSIEVMMVIACYILLNIAYSLGLKHVSIVDISIISVGFVLRILAGVGAINIPASMWIVVMTFLLALFLALAKRRDDVLLSCQGLNTRKSIDGYNLDFVNAAMIIMASVTVVAYIFYTISAEVQLRLQTEHLYLTVIFVLIGILRYMQITFVENNSGSPTKIVLKDRFLQLTILSWAASFGSIIYLGGS